MGVVNMIMSSASLRTGESWTPVCLPHLSDKAFAYAYISFIEGTEVGVVFLSTLSDGEQFYTISQQAATVKKTLATSGCLEHVGRGLGLCPIDLRAAGADDSSPRSERHAPHLGLFARMKSRRSARRTFPIPAPLGQWRLMEGVIHAAYFVPSLQQYFSSSVAPPYQTRRRTKTLFRTYGRCRLLLRSAKMPSQICIATDHECFYVSLTAEYHMYLAVPRGISTGVINQFYQWIKSQETHLFLGHLPTW